MWKKVIFPIAAIALLTGLFQSLQEKKNNAKTDLVLNKTVEKTAQFLIRDWKADQELQEVPPPQVIPVLSGSNIYGACGSEEANVTHWEIGGSSYCPRTHSIYLVPEELRAFSEAFGVSSIAYVLAHEFGHAFQFAYDVKIDGAALELQADCLAGVFIDVGSKDLGITRDDVLDMAQAAYSIGSESHGSGAQRKYALLSGMGVLSATCSNQSMQNLADGKINDPALNELTRTRSGGGSLDTSLTPYPKDINNALGL